MIFNMFTDRTFHGISEASLTINKLEQQEENNAQLSPIVVECEGAGMFIIFHL